MVSITVGDLLTAAAEDLEVVDSGNTPTTQEQASMIKRLQRLIDSSNVQKALIFGERIDLLTLTINKQTYTIGTDPTGTYTADFSVPRPTQIDRANLLLTSTVRRPLRVLDYKQWARIRYQQVSGPPRRVYFDNGFGMGSGSSPGLKEGFGTLYFYMIPDQAYQFELYTWGQNQNIAATTDLLNYPPEYADYWLYGLILRCANMFGRQPTETQIGLFMQASEVIGARNCPSPELVNADLNNRGAGYYNWLSGEVEDE